MKVIFNNSSLVFRHMEMNAFTEKVFSIANKYTIDSQQAKKLNKIVSLLDNNGLLSHLKLFMVPALASTVEQALYNFASDHQYTNSNLTMTDEGISLIRSFSRIDFVGNDILPTVNTFIYISNELGSGGINIYNHDTSWNTNTIININTPINKSIVNDIKHQENFSGYAASNDDKYRIIEISGLTETDVVTASKCNGGTFAKTGTINEGWELTSPLTNFNVAENTPQKYIIMAFDGNISLSDFLRGQLMEAVKEMSEVI